MQHGRCTGYYDCPHGVLGNYTHADDESSPLLPRVFEEICPIPTPYLNDVETVRYFHLDITKMSLEQLLLEKEAVEFRLRMEASSHPWVIARHEAVVAEIRRRYAVS